jgi:hypothetical protein
MTTMMTEADSHGLGVIPRKNKRRTPGKAAFLSLLQLDFKPV